eukprot:c39924_g1_i1.p1 GENE.c39924_g1_i1~~c39924_g1_i1.p1  ORF type:complete len:239 (-),score=60.62 c39924_g1_i1:62-778(-)
MAGAMDIDDTYYGEDPDTIEADDIEVEAALMTAGTDVEIPGSVPAFPPVRPSELTEGTHEFRRLNIPAHRMNPLRDVFAEVSEVVTQRMQLQIRVNTKLKCVEIRTCEATEFEGALQKATDYVKAFLLGFELADAAALLRLDDIYIDTFEVADVKALAGDHKSRAIGRIAGKGGKTKFTIENATKTRLVVADQYIHIMGSFNNIKVARRAVCSLIMGTPPSKVYGHLRGAAAAMSTGF